MGNNICGLIRQRPSPENIPLSQPNRINQQQSTPLSVSASEVGRPAITEIPRSRLDNTHGVDFSLHSYGNPPKQRVDCLKADHYRNDPNARAQLPDIGETGLLSNGGKIVGISGVGFDKNRLISHSFSSCTPIIAFYSNGDIGLYHASSAARDDDKRQELLDKNPTDVFVVTKPENGSHRQRQSAHAIDLITDKPSGCNVHIVEVPRSTLAIEATPSRLAIFQMD